MGLNNFGSFFFPVFFWKREGHIPTPRTKLHNNHTPSADSLCFSLCRWKLGQYLDIFAPLQSLAKSSLFAAESGTRSASRSNMPSRARTGAHAHGKVTPQSDPRAHPFAHVHTSTNKVDAQGHAKVHDDVSFFLFVCLQTTLKCELLILER